MAYSPAVTPRSDQYIAAAGASITNDIAQFMKEQREELKQKEFNVGVATQLAKSGQISPEDMQGFLKLNTDKQAGILAQHARGQVEARQMQQFLLESRYKQALMGNMAADNTRANLVAGENAALLPIKKRVMESTAAAAENAGKPVLASDGKTQVGVFDANGSPHMFAAALQKTNEPAQVDPLIDPTTGKPVAGMGIVRLTGQTVSTSADVPGVLTDPSGKFYFDNKNRNWKPLPAAKAVDPQKAAMAALLTGGDPAAPAGATPAPAAPQFQSGEVRRQGGHTYQFDGTKWNLVQ